MRSRSGATTGPLLQTFRLIALLCLLSLGVTGCLRARAAGANAVPPLDVPQPPTREFSPAEVPLPAEASVPDAPVPAVAPVTPRPPVPRRAVSPQPDTESRPEPTPPVPVPLAPDPSRELRAASPAADAQAERTVRDTVARSTRDLGRVNVSRLSADGRAQFEQARRFLQQAEAALRTKNFPFAATLADKAASLAADLAGR